MAGLLPLWEKSDLVTQTNVIIRKVKFDITLKPCYKYIIYDEKGVVNNKIKKRLYNKCWGKQVEPTKKTRKKVEHIWKETVKMEMSRYHKRRLQYAL